MHQGPFSRITFLKNDTEKIQKLSTIFEKTFSEKKSTSMFVYSTIFTNHNLQTSTE